jgi:hypothetical protein
MPDLEKKLDFGKFSEKAMIDDFDMQFSGKQYCEIVSG